MKLYYIVEYTNKIHWIVRNTSGPRFYILNFSLNTTESTLQAIILQAFRLEPHIRSVCGTSAENSGTSSST